MRTSLKQVKEPGILDGCESGSAFHKHKYRNERNCDNCLKGLRKYQKDYSVANADKARLRARKWFAENKERGIATRMAYRKKFPEKRLIEGAKYRQGNQSEINKRNARWKKDNPEQTVKDNHVRRARKLGVLSEPYTVRQVLNLYGTDCHLCDEPIDLEAPRSGRKKGWQFGLHIDHLIPLSKGGSGLLQNVRPSHAICNLKKSNKLVNCDSQP